MAKKYEIVCDVDQTLLFWNTREEMLKPKLNLKLLSLLQGYSTLLCTARGKGTRGFNSRLTPEQSSIVLNEMKQGFKELGQLPFTLNIDKPYAECYLDDKSANPANFVSVNGNYQFLFSVYNSRLFNLVLTLAYKVYNAFN